MTALSKADVLAAIAEKPEIEAEEVDCPELGGSVLVKEMPGTVRNRLEAAFAAIADGADGAIMDKVIASMISACTVDADGRPYLTGDMARKLFANHPRAAFRIRDAVVKMSALDESDAEEMAESFG